ncbi:MAG: folate-binding protein [Alcanivoracaceae bacterium]|jgi:folate-binding protein YgfZ|nr:folate-binding protein [Alcanivoracaceae bacterium]
MTWQQLLDDLGAQRNAEGAVSHFSNTPDASLVIGDHLAVISVRGPETEKFLQGQLTCDLHQVFAGQWRLAMHLDLKGRGQYSYLVLPATDGVDLLTSRQRVDAALAALKKYALFSKVALTRQPGQVPLLLREPTADNALHGVPVPAEVGHCSHGNNSALARVSVDTLLLLTTEDGARHLLNHYTVAELGGVDAWLRHEIDAGIGHILPGGEGLWLPQALNYDLLDGVNFRKGCYLGQEVVARMHFKGKMKQRMQHLRWQSGISGSAGGALRDAQGQAAGELVSAVSSAHHTDALVVLRLDHQGSLSLNDQPLDWEAIELPYPLPA